MFFNFSFAQKKEFELLKYYDSYIEKKIESGKWIIKNQLLNGLVIVQEYYGKNELRNRTKFEYDNFGNVIRQIEIYNINDGKINTVSEFKLEYNDNLLIKKEFNYGLIEKYSNFTKLGKPKLIERITDLDLFPYKEIFEYDKNGNIVTSITFTTYKDIDNKTVNEKNTTHFKYDKRNNVIEIHREFEPKQEFPIWIVGGPAQYEFEYFRYKYNKKGLWTKKYKTVNGKEYLAVKRKYK